MLDYAAAVELNQFNLKRQDSSRTTVNYRISVTILKYTWKACVMRSRNEGYLRAMRDAKDLLSMLATEPTITEDGKVYLRIASYHIEQLMVEKEYTMFDYDCPKLVQVDLLPADNVEYPSENSSLQINL